MPKKKSTRGFLHYHIHPFFSFLAIILCFIVILGLILFIDIRNVSATPLKASQSTNIPFVSHISLSPTEVTSKPSTEKTTGME